MKVQEKLITWFSFALVTIILLLFTFAQNSSRATTFWSRSLEPVILSGSQVPSYDGVDLHQIFAFAYQDGDWTQIPLQIDEVDASGNYGDEDGLLDENDELVFMAMDLGERVNTGNWILDAESRSYPRQEISVTNPLDLSEEGHVYLYRSSTILRTHGDYVDWDEVDKVITAGTYKLGLGVPFQGIDMLELNNNGVDVLDRSKFRLSVICRSGGIDTPFLFNEEVIPPDLEDLFKLSPEINGHVRAGGGTMMQNSWFYYSMRDNQFTIDFDSLKSLICEIPGFNFGRFDLFRLSFDWLDPVESGMAPMTYYDPNTMSGVLLDGTNDAVPALPVNPWTQVSGDHGSVVRVAEISENIIGTVLNYYLDESPLDPSDTGDQKSYGDSGFSVVFDSGQPEYGQLEVDLTTYILDPYQPNLGVTYLGFQQNPLVANASSQEFVNTLYLPVVIVTTP